AVQPLGEVYHHGGVAGLAGESGAAAARDDGRIVGPADLDGAHHVGFGVGDDHADRDLAVVRGVRGVERLVAVPEPHFALDCALQIVLQAPRVDLGVGQALVGDAPAGRLVDDAVRGGHAATAKRSASARLSASPWPGRAESGVARPAFSRGAPSNSMDSMRTWSWNHSMWASRGAAQAGARWMAGAQWLESGRFQASARSAARRKPVMPRQRVASACSTSTAPAASMRRK